MGIDVLIPVLGRPEAKEPLAESLSVTVTPYRLLFICNRGARGDIAACEAVGEVLVVPWAAGRADFAKKINFAFLKTDSDWIFQGADDIAFSPNWDLFALKTAQQTGKRVIGTNDLHNPSVRRGKHSTHTLFHRSYIEEHGGTTDDTGLVFCELYDHQYCDSEFIEVAKRRQEFAFSRSSIVEHFHPHWGNREPDRTHRKATRQSNADRKLYAERMGIVNPRRTRANRKRDINP